MRALSIRQPRSASSGQAPAELILRGIKRIEFRSRPTRILGERWLLELATSYETKLP
jgi:hypothetical protein